MCRACEWEQKIQKAAQNAIMLGRLYNNNKSTDDEKDGI